MFACLFELLAHNYAWTTNNCSCFPCNLRVSDKPQNCAMWVGKCIKWGKKRGSTNSVNCVNFYWKWVGFLPCRSVQCGSWYCVNGEISFCVKEMPMEWKDKERFEEKWKSKEDEGNCIECRAGYHVLVPFGCNLSIFIILKGQHALERVKDENSC